MNDLKDIGITDNNLYTIKEGKPKPLCGCTGKPLDIDRKLTIVDVAEELDKMVALLQEMSIEEIIQVHTSALQEIQPDEKVTEYLNSLVAGIIADKEKEGVIAPEQLEGRAQTK